MSEEEKKAIEYWKRDIALYHWNTQLASEHYAQIILNLIEKQQKELEEYERIFDVFNERKYRKKYLEERRKEEPNLLYPDTDEIYQKYYEEKVKNKDLEEKLKIAVAILTKGTYPEENEGDNDFDKQFIAADKIKELINEYKNVKIPGVREFFEKIEKMLLEEK